MSLTSDQMELREDDIRKHYAAATAMLNGFEHAPRIAKPVEVAAERSPGVSTGRRFRSTTPGLVTRRVARADGVHLVERIEASDEGDTLVSPPQATTQQVIRRAIAIALAVAEAYAEQTPLADLKRSKKQKRCGSEDK